MSEWRLVAGQAIEFIGNFSGDVATHTPSNV